MSKRPQNIAESSSLNIEELLTVIRENTDGLSVKELADIYGLNRPSQKNLTKLLNNLQGTGIIKRHGNDYRWADSNRVYLGTLRQRRRKNISFIPDDDHERARGRIQVFPEDTNGSFDSDRVIAYISRGPNGNRTAKVQMLVQRGQLNVIGRLHRAHRFVFVESLDEKFPFEIDVENDVPDEDGKIVVIEINRYPSAYENPAGQIVESLGAFSSDPGLDIEIVIRKHDLPHIFPPEVELEASEVSPIVTAEQCMGRLDLRGQTIVTIDGETARDFDDAISLQKLANGNYALGVHIADVSYYVQENTPLDNEAALRGTSVYFPERAIPMLPEKLSNGICSLNPKVDRLTMSALMEVNQDGQVLSYQLRETVIRSCERMTYTDVNKVLQKPDPEILARYESLIPFFQLMEELALKLIKMRERRGAIDFNLPEAVFRFNDEGQIAGVLKAERNIAHRIIEEFMLLANETVAAHLEKLGIPSLYRIHEEPEPQRVIEFAELATAFGYRFPVTGVKSQDYQRLSQLLSGKPEEKVLSYAMLRSLQRARYAAKNLGHFGLAAKTYTHFTSPIRRYPDLIVHRILRALLHRSIRLGDSSTIKSSPNTRNTVTPIPRQLLESIAEESSERERAADAAERELEDWRKAALMATHVGDEFDGLVVNVRDFGFFVELNDLFIEGLVSVQSLTDDYYEFDSRRHALRSRTRSFKLGDRVRVRLDRVNVDKHLIDFSVVNLQNTSSPKRRNRYK